MMRKVIVSLLALGILGAALGWILTAPNWLDKEIVDSLPVGDATAGRFVFWAGGCSSCHAQPKATGDDKLRLGGGLQFKTPFGTFVAPNISPHDTSGIGSWSDVEFANAMMRGVSPDGSHYYPAFPYASYSRMEMKDVIDLWSFLKTLPSVEETAGDHDLSFPFNIRRGLGLWKQLYLRPQKVIAVKAGDVELERGRYLVEALGHCGECHTPRNFIGGPDNSRWLAGGISPEGNEKIPNITPHADGLGGWSAADIENSLETGFTPEFDSFGSSMADVQLNMAKLPKSDRQAIAAYLKSIPSVAGKP